MERRFNGRSAPEFNFELQQNRPQIGSRDK